MKRSGMFLSVVGLLICLFWVGFFVYKYYNPISYEWVKKGPECLFRVPAVSDPGQFIILGAIFPGIAIIFFVALIYFARKRFA